jgi:hypothetical protein
MPSKSYRASSLAHSSRIFRARSLRVISASCCVVVAASANVLAAQPLRVPPVIEASAERTPPKFEIQLKSKTVLVGGPDVLPKLTDGTLIVDRQGRRFVTPKDIGVGGNAAAILVYDANGNFLKRIAKDARGPEDRTFIPHVLPWRGDSVLVYEDGIGARANLLSSDFKFVRTVDMQLGAPIVLSNGWIVSNIWPEKLDDERYHHLNVFSPDGKLLKVTRLAIGMRPRFAFSQVLGSSLGSPAIWVAHAQVLTMAKWDTSSQRIVELTVKQDGTPFAPYAADSNLRVSVGAMSEDKQGRLWVLMNLNTWMARKGDSVAQERFMTYQMLAVIDAKTGSVLAMQNLPAGSYNLIKAGALYSSEEAGDGTSTLTIWDAVLVPMRK